MRRKRRCGEHGARGNRGMESRVGLNRKVARKAKLWSRFCIDLQHHTPRQSGTMRDLLMALTASDLRLDSAALLAAHDRHPNVANARRPSGSGMRPATRHLACSLAPIMCRQLQSTLIFPCF